MSTSIDMAPDAALRLAEAMGMSAEAMQAFMENVDKAAQKLSESPREELKWRLNSMLKGEDPGQPVNWRGL